MTLKAGSRLGRYRILDTLGKGGMGEVYRAHDARLDREIAIKVLPAELASTPEMVQRFQREARAIAAVNHPSIVTIHSVEEADGVQFLTMELIGGQSLDRLIPSTGLNVDRVLMIADALAGALAAAHDRGIVHRDLKPANIMVTADGAVKVLDFGLAKLQAPNADDTPGADMPTVMQTSAGVVMGTLPYMSPEQIQGRPLDQRTDIFSLGVILYEMATGRRPFREESSAALSAAILRDSPPPVTDLRAELPDELARVVRRCLEKDPQRRIQTAREVGNQLRETPRLATLSAALPPAGAGSGRDSSAPDAQPAPLSTRTPASGETGFWVAVVPFTCTGASPDLQALAEGLTEEIVAGLSRFSYLHVLTKGSTGARYVLEGSLRRAGAQLRAAVRLIDTSTGANLWAENYTRSYSPDAVFEIQDSLAPPIVSTIAEMNGVLAHNMWITLRDRAPETLTPYEAMLRSFGYYECFTPEEYRLALAGLKRAIEQEPNDAGCLTMLAIVYANGYLLHHDPNEKQDDLALVYARRAVASGPSNSLAHYALCVAQTVRKDIPAFRSAAERALALNPLDGAITGEIGLFMSYTGEWHRGRELIERAMALNPRHPGFFWYPLVHDAYRQKDYPRALDYALRLNLPGQFWTHVVMAMVYGQLGNRDAAGRALRELLAIYPDFPEHARQEIEKFFHAQPDHGDHVLEGLRKAGLEIPDDLPVARIPGTSVTGSGPMAADQGFWAAVAPFQSRGVEPALERFAEGLTEEINAGLSRFSYLHLIPLGADRTAARYIMEGNIRQAGSRLRVTAQLSDTTTATQLWADTYEREFSAADMFDVQDDLVARIVSTCADQYGVLPRSISDVVRGTDPTSWSPYEALVHFFGYHQRVTPADHRAARAGLERAVEIAPRNADCWAVLSLVYAHEHGHGFNPRPNPLERAVHAARKAVDLSPGNSLAHQALSTALLLRKELTGCLHEADRAIGLNPLDAGCKAVMGANIAFAGDWDRGCALIERAMDLNPQHPVWYRGMLSFREYVKANYRAAVDEARKTDAPEFFWLHVVLAAANGQLGEWEAAAAAVRALHALVPDFAANAGAILGTWLQPDDVEHFMNGLRKAGALAPAGPKSQPPG